MKNNAEICHELRWSQKVLVVGKNESKQSQRASILRAHGFQVDIASTLAEAGLLRQQNNYNWVFLDVHSYLPGTVLDFCQQLRDSTPQPRIAFFVGPPTYVSAKWPSEQAIEDKDNEQRRGEAKAAA